MESTSNADGLVLTIVSMLVVFIVLAANCWLVEMFSALISRQEHTEESTKSSLTTSHPQTVHHQMIPNKKYQQVAELTALVLASEDKPNKKFEIIESKRVK